MEHDNYINQIQQEEHDHLPGKVAVKKVGNYIWNGTDWERWGGDITAQVDLTQLDRTNYMFYDDAEDANYDYVAKQSAQGNWFIARYPKTGVNDITKYAVGSSDLATAWSNFAGQTYADWDTNNSPTSSGVLSMAGIATEAKQDIQITKLSDGTQKSQLVDLDGHIANVQAVTSQISGDEYGVITNAIMHGLDAQGHWHDVKVTHSGAMTVEGKITESALPTGAATSANQTNGSQITQIMGKTSDSTFQVPRINPQTHVLNIIDYAHHEIHSGSSYTVCETNDTPNGGNFDILITTANDTAWSHFVYEIETEAESDISIYEGTTTSNNGTSVPVFNRDRNSANTSGTLVFKAPTVTAVGTKIRCWHPGGGKTFGGGDRGTHEIILKQNTKYLIRVTNATVSNNYMSVKLDWYNHTNRSA